MGAVNLVLRIRNYLVRFVHSVWVTLRGGLESLRNEAL